MNLWSMLGTPQIRENSEMFFFNIICYVMAIPLMSETFIKHSSSLILLIFGSSLPPIFSSFSPPPTFRESKDLIKFSIYHLLPL